MAARFVDGPHDLGRRVRQDERERDVLEHVLGRDSAWRHIGRLCAVLLRPQPVLAQQWQGGPSRHLGAMGQDCARLYSRCGDRPAAQRLDGGAFL